MAYYLQMDGVDDRLQLPTMTATRIVIDCNIDSVQDGTRDVIFDARPGNAAFLDIGFTNLRFYLDGGSTPKTAGWADIPKDSRRTLDIRGATDTTAMTDDFTIFAKSDGTTPLKGKIYSVKVYNLAALVAYYDMSLGHVQDISGNGNHATLTGGTFVEFQPGTRFLTMDGVSNYIKFPSITFDRVVLDFTSRIASSRFYVDARSGQSAGYLQRTAANQDNWGASISGVKVNGTSITNGATAIPQGARSTVDIQYAAALADDINILSSSSNSQVAACDLYNIWIYNAGVLVAWLDMSTGTVADQSGNGFNPILVGGVWNESPINSYLSMDGVDDRVQTPAFVATEFILEMKPRPQPFEQYVNMSSNVINSTGSNTDQYGAGFSAVYIDGVQVVNNTAFVKRDTKQVMRGVLTAPTSGGQSTNIYWNGAAGYMEGELYSLKIYNGSTLAAWYDMTRGDLMTGKLYDLSGNSRHATLTGGTWQTSSGSVGTPGSVSIATKQTITQTSSAAYATKQTINSTAATAYATKQTLYAISSIAYATQQTIYSGAIAGAVSYATKQVLTRTAADIHATKQVINRIGSAVYATLQQIANISTVTFATKQVITETSSSSHATRQRLFAVASVSYATKQRFNKAGLIAYATLQNIVDANNAISHRVSISGSYPGAAIIKGEKEPGRTPKRSTIGGEV